MAKSQYLTAPVRTASMPPGIPYLIGNEGAERFSYYGMRAILVIFMTTCLMNRAGQLDPMPEAQAKGYYHLFISAVYFFPLFGAILAEGFLGKYRTIMALSIVYCFGHLALALDDTRLGLAIGLTLIAIGSGGIKPCVSANLGDQFGQANQHLISKVFGWFYFAINFGSFISTLLTPWLLDHVGPRVAFGVPGLLMFLATLIFWLGRKKYVHIPPGGWAFVRETFSAEGLRRLGSLFVLYIFVAIFWALYDQTGSSWVLQATRMDRHLFGIQWDAAQIQAVNPILILLFIPLFSYGIYPLIDLVFPLTPLRKIGIGFFLCSVAFLIPALVEQWIAAGHTPSIGWQLLAYVVLTAAEVLVSITFLEFSYTQAPRRMKSLIMALFNLSVSMGNAFTSGLNFVIARPDGTSRLEGPAYFLFFAGLMALAGLVFVGVAMRYREKVYLQDEEPAAEPAQASA